MAGIIEYVQQELRTFEEEPFNEVDSLVLSQLAYLQLGCLVPYRGRRSSIPVSGLFRAEFFDSLLFQVRDREQNLALLTALCASPRFRSLRLCNFVDERDPVQEKQFVAVTLLLGSRSRYLAFRGTDADVVGWKEDFNMAFQSPVPAQRAAVEYVNFSARTSMDRLILGGHSKGGNLAAYSAIHCPRQVQNRMEAVYSHDGPGFKNDPRSEPGYLQVQEKIHKTMPQSAVVGMLLEHQENYSVVKSNRMGLLQHDPFSWQVENGRFVRLEEISAGARHMNDSLNRWLSTQSDSQREEFVNALFGLLDAFNIKNFAQDEWDWQQLPAMLETLKNIDEETQKMLRHTLKELAKMSVQGLSKSAKKKS